MAVVLEGKSADESHRARLRVEAGRLRRVLRSLAGVSATKRGFALAPRHAPEIVVLARPDEAVSNAVLYFAVALTVASGVSYLLRAFTERPAERSAI